MTEKKVMDRAERSRLRDLVREYERPTCTRGGEASAEAQADALRDEAYRTLIPLLDALDAAEVRAEAAEVRARGPRGCARGFGGSIHRCVAHDGALMVGDMEVCATRQARDRLREIDREARPAVSGSDPWFVRDLGTVWVETIDSATVAICPGNERVATSHGRLIAASRNALIPLLDALDAAEGRVELAEAEAGEADRRAREAAMGAALRPLREKLSIVPEDRVMFRRTADGVSVTARELVALLERADPLAVEYLDALNAAACEVVGIRAQRGPTPTGLVRVTVSDVAEKSRLIPWEHEAALLDRLEDLAIAADAVRRLAAMLEEAPSTDQYARLAARFREFADSLEKP